MRTHLTSTRWLMLLVLPTLGPQLSTALAQGSLTPPGSPAPTMKTLAQIEPRTPISSLPYTITNPGSYYLTTNLNSAGQGITISADNVAIDLSGFGITTASNGIATSPSIGMNNIAIRNGTISGCTSDGISAWWLVALQNITLEELQIANCGGNGAIIFGQSAVRNCRFVGNGSNGVTIVEGIISGCLAQSNKMSGIYIRSTGGGVVESCHVTYNGNGIKAICSLVTHCMASSNTTNGILAECYCRVIDNVVFANGCGIYLERVLKRTLPAFWGLTVCLNHGCDNRF